MTAQPGAIVIGGSVAGLLAARALVDTQGPVLILDRDDLPAEPAVRRCAGQGAHVHLLLDSGRQAMEALVPGLFDAIAEGGGRTFDFGTEFAWYHGGFFKHDAPSRFHVRMQSRPLLEHHLRARVRRIDGIELRGSTRVTGLALEGGRVAGVRVAAGDDEQLVRAPVVVDAGGRGSQTWRWLERAGVGAPPTEEVALGIGYATRSYQRPADAPQGRGMFATYGRRRATRRHGVLFEVEDGRWMVTLVGYQGDHPPRDPSAFEAWVHTLEHPQIAHLIADAQPISDVAVFKAPIQIRRHYERLDLPEGLAVLGDAACALDPVFGQGMSVAAITAHRVHQHLADHPFRSRAVQQIVAGASTRPWLVTTAEAWRYPEADPPPGVGIAHAFLDRVYAVSAVDPLVYAAFTEVVHLHRHAAHLLRPDLLWRILRPRLGQAAPRRIATRAEAERA